MGLGKTVVAICSIEDFADEKVVQSGLIVVPASLKYQWRDQIAKFTGGEYDLRAGRWVGGRLERDVMVIDGTPAQRAAQYAQARERKPLYIILNYEKVRDDWAEVAKLPRDFVVCDELTVCKSFRAKISKRMKRLQPETDILIGLTGQPIENRPEDLFSIMQVVDDEVLGRWDHFDRLFLVRDGFGRVTRVKNLPLLWELMGEAMVRKTRADPDVAPFMPDVEEVTVPVEFDRATAKVYGEIALDLRNDIAEAMSLGRPFDLMAHYLGEEGGDVQGRIMSKLTALRMLCDHPDLLRLSADNYLDAETKLGSAYAYEVVKERGLLDRITRTPKFTVFLERMLWDLQDPAAKTVVFSSFKPTLTWLREALAEHGVGAVLFTGDMNATQKDTAKRAFTDDPNCRVFLSSDAGGYGLDLPNANVLRNFDLPWSSGKWAQRNSRIIRLSSEFTNVIVENYVIQGSLEERQLAMLQQKRAISEAMIDRRGADARGRLTLDLEALSTFLDTRAV